MPTRTKVGVLLLVLLVGSILVGIGLQRVFSQPTFNVIFRYGHEGKNILNTFNGTFTKDMIVDPSITTNLVLTQDEMNSIRSMMDTVRFFSVSQSDLVQTARIFPTRGYSLSFQNSTLTKELSWPYGADLNVESGSRLENLADLIIGIVQSHQEFKMLPEPNGGYA
jgi:hypothetical protein